MGIDRKHPILGEIGWKSPKFGEIGWKSIKFRKNIQNFGAIGMENRQILVKLES